MDYTRSAFDVGRTDLNAETIRAALRCWNPRCACWRLRGSLTHCPRHDDQTPSFSVRDGTRALLVTCFAGCPRAEVIAVLRERGLWPGSVPRPRIVRYGLGRRWR